MPSLRRPSARLARELLALAVAIIAVLFVSFHAPGSATPAATFTPPTLGGQPPNAVVLGKERGDLAVGLAIQPASGKLLLVATVIGQAGTGVPDLHASFTLETSDGQTRTGQAVACSPGCYETTIATTARPTKATIDLGAGAAVSFKLPARWPPRPAAALVRKAAAEYTQLKTLVTHERLATDATHADSTVYRALAPDSLETSTRGKSESVQIGRTRWDRPFGGAWTRTKLSAAVPSITPYWAGRLQDETLLGSETIDGHPAWVVSFVALQFPAFFTIWIDKQTSRTLRLEMTGSAHFMRHDYGPFDRPLAITPPA